MAKRMTIGLYIAHSDTDILAWCNMMRDNHLPISKWVAALLMAEKLDATIDIGAITPNVKLPTYNNKTGKYRVESEIIVDIPAKSNKPLLFGSGNTQATQALPIPKKKQWAYGWQVKAADGSYVAGSVINVSIARQELQHILNKLREDGHLLAPHIKALIRQSLKTESELRAPAVSDVSSIFSRFVLAVASAPTAKKSKPHVQEPPFLKPPQSANPMLAPVLLPTPTPAQQLQPTQPPKKKNPLLCNI